MSMIKDNNGRVLGQTKSFGGRETMFSNTGRVVGSYDSRTNRTFSEGGRVVSQGNTLTNRLK